MLKAGRAVVLLLAVLSPAAGEPPPPAAQRWIAAVREHQPGTVDEALLEVSGWPPNQFETVRQELGRALALLTASDRTDVLRRGALLHTDIAILAPERAASYTRVPSSRRAWSLEGGGPAIDPSRATSVIIGVDGQFLASVELTAHWWFARRLLEMIRPESPRDPFVAAWYRATTARFLATYAFGVAAPHLQDARKLLPQDPWVLFYSGALHEAYAAPRSQNIVRSGPEAYARVSAVRAPRAELEDAAEFFRKAAAADPAPVEAHVRLGRVLGQLGRHTQAADELRRAQALADTPDLQYYSELFLGIELGSLARFTDARQAFERAAALFPTAQSPWIGLSAVARRSGDRKGALAALQRLSALPADHMKRTDPWWEYFHSHSRDATVLMDGLRTPFLKGGKP